MNINFSTSISVVTERDGYQLQKVDVLRAAYGAPPEKILTAFVSLTTKEIDRENGIILALGLRDRPKSFLGEEVLALYAVMLNDTGVFAETWERYKTLREFSKISVKQEIDRRAFEISHDGEDVPVEAPFLVPIEEALTIFYRDDFEYFVRGGPTLKVIAVIRSLLRNGVPINVVANQAGFDVDFLREQLGGE